MNVVDQQPRKKYDLEELRNKANKRRNILFKIYNKPDIIYVFDKELSILENFHKYECNRF